MAQIVWTASALKHVQDIVDFVAKDSPTRAEALGTRLMDAADILVHTPKIGRRVPEFDLDPIRELVTVRPYRLLYVLREDTCHIVAIIHSSRDLTRLLRPDDLLSPEEP